MIAVKDKCSVCKKNSLAYRVAKLLNYFPTIGEMQMRLKPNNFIGEKNQFMKQKKTKNYFFRCKLFCP